MKHFILLFALIGSFIVAHGQNKNNIVFQIVTYNQDNKENSKGYGFFIGEKNEGVVPYQLLRNATKAEIIDSKGKKSFIYRLIGANSTNNLAKFSIDGTLHKGAILTKDSIPSTEPVYVVTYAKGKQLPLLTKITKTHDFLNYKLYDLDLPNKVIYFGCPIINQKGEVIGVVQENSLKNAQNAYAVDARFLKAMESKSLNILNQDLKAIPIAKALPEKERDGLSFIYMMNQNDSTLYLTAINDFLEMHPNSAEGYVVRGTYYANKENLPLAQADFNTALEKSALPNATYTSDQVHFALGKLIYTLYMQHQQKWTWTLNDAIEEFNQAYAIKASPLYTLYKAKALFALHEYTSAFEAYQSVNKSEFSSAESFFSAATCLLLEQKDSLEALSLMDSCINRLPHPISVQNASYLYNRAQLNAQLGKYRQAVFDYNEYEKILGPSNLTALFYYIREQAEKSAKMYQQALEDIRFAQTKSQKPDYYDYRLEEALLLLQIAQFDEAIHCAQTLLQELPENPDCYKIIGLAYALTKQKDKAQKYLQKAHELGDPQALRLLETYR